MTGPPFRLRAAAAASVLVTGGVGVVGGWAAGPVYGWGMAALCAVEALILLAVLRALAVREAAARLRREARRAAPPGWPFPDADDLLRPGS